MAKKISERVFDHCVVQDADGKILFNSAMEDIPVVRRMYDDGTVTFTKLGEEQPFHTSKATE